MNFNPSTKVSLILMIDYEDNEKKMKHKSRRRMFFYFIKLQPEMKDGHT